jgi:hypothetical protein
MSLSGSKSRADLFGRSAASRSLRNPRRGASLQREARSLGHRAENCEKNPERVGSHGQCFSDRGVFRRWSSYGYFALDKVTVAAKDDLVRIVDESGEDYLYHQDHFLFVDFPSSVTKKTLALHSVS